MIPLITAIKELGLESFGWSWRGERVARVTVRSLKLDLRQPMAGLFEKICHVVPDFWDKRQQKVPINGVSTSWLTKTKSVTISNLVGTSC